MENKPAKRPPYVPARKQFKYRSNRCRNCDHPLDLSDKYCPNCGQINSVKKLSLRDLFDEFFGNLVNYDSRLRQTLKALLLKPGKITREYINGKHASYTNPFRFLLSLCIIYFLMLGSSSDFERLDKINNEPVDINALDTEDQAKLLDSLESRGIITGMPENPEKKQALKDSLNVAIDTIRSAARIFEALDHRKDSLAKNDPITYYREVLQDSATGIEHFAKKAEFFYRTIKNEHYTTPEEASKLLNTPLTGSELWAFRIGKSMHRVVEEPGTFLNTTISRLPFFIFFFLPLFALFIWLIYIRRNFSYMDHLIFSFHSQSLFIILLIFAYIVDWITNWNVLWVAVLVFSFYLYKAMRVFYQQGRLKTIVKFMILNTIFVILVSISIILFLSGSALTY
ncbi:DUF3667 domain-containing protein [Robertkochia flava]|uniref:DUF3667 domain-containing protein n=1 Tax=Robertkochia flava TaxID=3447986 RepID=UPI001CCBF49C|nr:DUF3667 domain-containing protein [Robertkochia marina]